MEKMTRWLTTLGMFAPKQSYVLAYGDCGLSDDVPHRGGAPNPKDDNFGIKAALKKIKEGLMELLGYLFIGKGR